MDKNQGEKDPELHFGSRLGCPKGALPQDSTYNEQSPSLLSVRDDVKKKKAAGMWTADLYFPKHEEKLLKDQVSRNTGVEKKR